MCTLEPSVYFHIWLSLLKCFVTQLDTNLLFRRVINWRKRLQLKSGTGYITMTTSWTLMNNHQEVAVFVRQSCVCVCVCTCCTHRLAVWPRPQQTLGLWRPPGSMCSRWLLKDKNKPTGQRSEPAHKTRPRSVWESSTLTSTCWRGRKFNLRETNLLCQYRPFNALKGMIWRPGNGVKCSCVVIFYKQTSMWCDGLNMRDNHSARGLNRNQSQKAPKLTPCSWGGKLPRHMRDDSTLSKCFCVSSSQRTGLSPLKLKWMTNI